MTHSTIEDAYLASANSMWDLKSLVLDHPKARFDPNVQAKIDEAMGAIFEVRLALEPYDVILAADPG